MNPKQKKNTLMGLSVALLVLIFALAFVMMPGEEIVDDNKDSTNNTPSENMFEGTVVLGSKLFNEQYILAHMLSLLAEEEGYATEVKENLGGTLVNYEALKKGQISAYPEYTGTAYSVILKEPTLDVWSPEVVYDESENGLEEEGVTIAANVGFRDDYAIAVNSDWAEANSVESISDLEGYVDEMSIGTDPEFATRDDGLPQMMKVYGFTFGDVKSMEPTLMYPAIDNGEVDAISAYTTDARVDRFNLTLLEDDKAAFPAYEAIIIVNEDVSRDEKLMAAFGKLDGAIDTETMRSLNKRYDVDQEDARDIARDWLVSAGMISA
jgi:osmoprotectant transport system substrate-binding protein